MEIDAMAEWLNRGRIERGVVSKPTPNHGVDFLCEVIKGEVHLPMEPP